MVFWNFSEFNLGFTWVHFMWGSSHPLWVCFWAFHPVFLIPIPTPHCCDSYRFTVSLEIKYCESCDDFFFILIFLSSPEDTFLHCSWRERKGEREKQWLLASHMSWDLGSKLQPRHVPWPFSYGWHSKQQSPTGQGLQWIFPQRCFVYSSSFEFSHGFWNKRVT